MSLYANMLKVDVRSAKVRVRARYSGSGSVKAETVETGCEGIETELFIESDEDPIRVAKLARVSEAGCFVIQTIRNPTQVTTCVRLNGNRIG